MSAERILMGVVGRAHGVRGLVRVHSYTGDPAALAAYGPLLDERGGAWSLEWHGDGIAALRGPGGAVADRTAAERLVSMRLYVDRARLPEPAADEFYLHDLIGLPAFGPDGAALGAVTQVHDYGAGASLEIGGSHKPLIVPFTRASVPVVDLGARRIVVAPPDEVVGEAPQDVAQDASEAA